MARGGINKVVVQKAREALLARGENPSIDAVRVEMGNTGSKTTIHRYLKELEDNEQHRSPSTVELSAELGELVARLAARLKEEGAEQVSVARLQFDSQRAELQAALDASRSALESLQQRFDIQAAALAQESEQLTVCRTSLQVEQTRNARLSQACEDLEVRLLDKDSHLRSLEEKHLHARDALEHYRNAVKEQREQEQRRHEGQLQQLQMEQRQLQQSLMIKQGELTQLNRDNERLISDVRQLNKQLSTQNDAVERQLAQINGLQTLVAQAEGGKQMLQTQIGDLKQELRQANDELVEHLQLRAQAQERHESTHRALEALRQQVAELQRPEVIEDEQR